MKDKLFLDTNVVLDLLGEREPFYDSAAKIATLADKGKIHLVVSALTYSTVYYVLSRFEDKEQVKEKIRKFKVIAETSDLTEKVVDKGLSSGFSDFEDSLQYYCAINRDCKILITRNGKDFKESDIPVLSPDEYLNSLKAK
ncbi:MAG: PIN domain-containing protein [Bacteroidales bacterium]|nr:PIN domain-containing protein [Bacteroidales bacterium]MCF8343602.1 PIN domain-containing protein [Bacteroidales bacterium]MCF8350975.1 PIN domain-containing protein [Bacteroidales bacterium]MCF8374956.1 PIN domain-containing protein [Bacteroidales bacterium]MCF8400065.1 PIN domain-containing protein [Bacteroidales bacterium]